MLSRYFSLLLSLLYVMSLTGCLGGGGGTPTADNLPGISSVAIVVSEPVTPDDNITTNTLTIVVRKNIADPVAVRLSSNSPTALISPINSMTDADGILTATIRNSVAETVEVRATAGNVTSAPAIVTFAAPEKPATLADGLIISTNTPVLGMTDTAEVLIRTTNAGRPLGGVKVTVSVAGNVTTQTTNAQGETRLQVSNNGQTGIINITASADGSNIQQSLVLYFGASLNILPAETNGAVGSTELSALLLDQNRSPISGVRVQFGLLSSVNEALSAASINTGIDGIARITVTDVGNDGGNVTVSARAGTLSSTARVNFITRLSPKTTMQVSVSGKVLALNQTATVVAQLTDDQGSPISQQPIRFLLSDRRNNTAVNAKLRDTEVLTDSNGRATTTLSGSSGENLLLVVQAGNVSAPPVDIYIGGSISLLAAQSEAVADGRTAIQLTASVNDAFRQGISGASVNFRVLNAGDALLSAFRLVSDEQGRAVSSVTKNTPGDVTVEAQVELLEQTATTNVRFTPGTTSTIRLSAATASLSLNGQTTITATVTDVHGNSVRDGTVINFQASQGVIRSAVPTHNGKATAIFDATTQAGLVTITASAANTSSARLTLEVQPASAGILELKSIDPQVIGISGSGVVQSARLIFIVRDNLGNLAVDGTQVNFSLGNNTLGGGEAIATDGSGGKTAVGRTNNGEVSVVLRSGAVAGNVDVIATIDGTAISSSARVTIVGGVPDGDRLSIASDFLNIAGGVTFGLQNTMRVIVADRFGNVVPNGTGVSFITEGGTIGTSSGNGAFTTSTEFGQATAVLQSANPTAPNLGGLPTLQRVEGIGGTFFDCAAPYEKVVNYGDSTPLCGNPGLNTVVAFTSGSESFFDVNGNGRFDPPEPFIDDNGNCIYDEGESFSDLNGNQRFDGDHFSNPGFIDRSTPGNRACIWDKNEVITAQGDFSEPYIDGNDNRIYDSGELFIDTNSNGQFDGPDGVYQDSTTIWIDSRTLFSARTVKPVITPDTFSIPNGESQTFFIRNIKDEYGNPLVAGTRITVRTTVDNDSTNPVYYLGGTTDMVLQDSNAPASEIIRFTLSSTFSSVLNATILVTITSPVSTDIAAPGSNGDVQVTATGKLGVTP